MYISLSMLVDNSTDRCKGPIGKALVIYILNIYIYTIYRHVTTSTPLKKNTQRFTRIIHYEFVCHPFCYMLYAI